MKTSLSFMPPSRARQGFVTVLVMVILAVLALLAINNARTLNHLKRSLERVEQHQHKQQLKSQPTNNASLKRDP